MLVASIVFERKSSLQFKVSDTLKEVLLKTLPAFIVPFPIQKNYPLQDIMAVLHGGMVFDLCCQQPLPDTLSCLKKEFLFQKNKLSSFIFHFFFRKAFTLVVEPRFPSEKSLYCCQWTREFCLFQNDLILKFCSFVNLISNLSEVWSSP